MKYMTNAQIDELNLLLDKHGAALTAFYNEGMRQGAKNVIHGMIKTTTPEMPVISGFPGLSVTNALLFKVL